MAPPTGIPIGQQPAVSEKAMEKGVEEAVLKWLMRNPYTVERLVNETLTRTFTKWLDANKAEVIASIAKAKMGK